MFVEPRVLEAELAFLNAPFEQDGWRLAVELMAAATGSRLGQLCGIAGNMRLPYNILSEEPHDPNRHLHNPVLYGPENWRIAVSRGVMQVQHDAHYNAHRVHHRTTFYDDAMSDLDVPYGCQTALSMVGDDILGLALLRSRRDGPCPPDVLQAFGRMARQAQRAMRAQVAIGQEAAELMLGDIGGRDEATILLDRFGGLAAMSDAAEHLFDEPGGLALQGLSVSPAFKGESDRFEAAIGRLLQSDGINGPILHEFRFGRSQEHPHGRWRGVLVRLPAAACGIGFAPELALTVTPL